MKLRLIAAALALLALSGCATIPSSGNIGFGPDVTSGLNNDEVYYSQTGPYSDATQEAVLYGFLNSGNGPQNDYAVAREYLTKSFASKWQPNDEVLIQEGTPELFKVSETEYRVTVGVSGQVDSEGRYTDLPAGTKRTSTIEFAKTSGQWRISAAPNQTTIIRPNFKVLFRSYSLYFFDPSLTYLVPEVRWFPSRASTGTRLMNSLLKGPSDWLKPAVVNVIPVGTKLNINSVTIEDGIAKVDLSSQALRVPTSKRALMKSQIAATLEQLTDVTNVEISIQRTPQTISQYVDGQPPSLGSSPIALTSNGLVRLNASGAQAIAGTAAKVLETQATDFAFSQTLNRLALVAPSGVHIYGLDSFNDAGHVVDRRANQLSPSFDPQGALWSLPAVQGAPFVVSGDTRKVLLNPWVAGVPISFAVSPEGARVAVVYQIDKIKQTYVFPVERNKLGQVVSLGKPILVSSAPNDSDKVTWADSVTLALVTPSKPTGFIPCLVTIGGLLNASTAIESASSITVNGTGQIFILQPDGNVVESRGSIWTTIAQNILALHL
ncbi:MAG: LpqB family beta-propeller domain-containing protein [Rhodoluna sp.]|nr:LpqB family beta-propeller domain-containing protein [Rhodoluna sp.]